MSLANVILTRLTAIQVGITVPGLDNPNINVAEPYQPSDPASVNCPFFINEVPIQRSQSDIPIASGMQYHSTTIDMMLALLRREGAIDLKYAANIALSWRDAVYAAFAQHVRLSYPSILIAGSTNANPIQVTTAVPHGLVNGDGVTISGHAVNTNANGAWTVTVVDYKNFTIPVAGNGVGGQTGQERKTQPVDLSNIVDAVIVGWSLVPYQYGSNEYIALQFPLRVREMYVTTIAG